MGVRRTSAQHPPFKRPTGRRDSPLAGSRTRRTRRIAASCVRLISRVCARMILEQRSLSSRLSACSRHAMRFLDRHAVVLRHHPEDGGFKLATVPMDLRFRYSES